jgi:hypothetical protein
LLFLFCLSEFLKKLVVPAKRPQDACRVKSFLVLYFIVVCALAPMSAFAITGCEQSQQG